MIVIINFNKTQKKLKSKISELSQTIHVNKSISHSENELYIIPKTNQNKNTKRCNVPNCNGQGNLNKNLKTHRWSNFL